MNVFKKSRAATIVLLVGVIIAVIWSVYYFFIKNNGKDIPATQTQSLVYLPNKIDVINKVNLSNLEKDQVVKSVDAFMNEYKLPHGDFQNSYALLIERRLNDVIQVTTNPEQAKSDAHAIIYLRKIDDIWQADKNAGPWCTLEEFERYNCE